MNIPTLTTEEAVDLLEAAIRSQSTVMMYGPPGIGKTSLVKQASARAGIRCIAINMPQLDSVDLRGIPYVEKEPGGARTHWAPPWFMGLKEPVNIFLDEITSCIPATTVAGMQLLLEHRIGDAILPPGCQVMAAGNTAEDNTIAYELPAPARNRMLQFKLAVSHGGWMKWALAANIDERIIKFLQDSANQLAGQIDVRQQAFASPRSWELLSNFMKQTADMRLVRHAAHGYVGETAAKLFGDFMMRGRQLKLTPEQVRADSKRAPIPTDAGDLAALITALAASATAKNLMVDVGYLTRLSKEHQASFLSQVAGHLQKDYSEWLKISK